MRRITVQIAAFLLAVLIMGYGQAASQTEDALSIDLQYTDRGASDFVVVFDAGFGTDASVWEPVIEAMGDSIRTIAYSRAGIGGSTAAETPRTIDEHIADLSELLASLGVTSNTVLVGHSYGGLLAAEMAETNPALVAGLVLVDPATRGQRSVFKAADAKRVAADDAMLLSVMPPVMQADYQVLIDQMDSSGDAVTPLPADMPVVLFSSTAKFAQPFVFEETEMGRALWLQVHQELFSNVQDGAHIRVSDAGHNIHTEQPETVAAAIVKLVERLDNMGN